MFKRIFSLIICAVMCISTLPAVALEQDTGRIMGEKVDNLPFRTSLLTGKPSAINVIYHPGYGGLESATDGDPDTSLRIRVLRPFTMEFDLGQMTNFDQLCLIEGLSTNATKEITISYSDDRVNWEKIGPLISQYDLKQTVTYDFNKLPPLPDTAKDYASVGEGVGRDEFSDNTAGSVDTEEEEAAPDEDDDEKIVDEEGEEDGEVEEEGDGIYDDEEETQSDDEAGQALFKFNSWRFPSVSARYVNIEFSRVTSLARIHELQLFSSKKQSPDFDPNINVGSIESTIPSWYEEPYNPYTAPLNEYNPEPKESSLIWEDENGTLQYAPYNDLGDTLPDFSAVGYKHGNVPIPDVPVKEVLEPIPGSEDDSVRIQEAIDRVGALPEDANGLRGAVLLKKGRYTLKKALTISNSGVVLRGEGKGDDGTVLFDTVKTRRATITVKGSGVMTEQPGTRTEITDLYVPVGGKQFHVADPAMFNIGDEIIVHTMKNNNWVNELEMGDSGFLEGSKYTRWTPENYQFYNRKTIVDIDGNLITVDVPVMDALDKRFDYSQVYAYVSDAQIYNVGVEDLQVESDFDKTIIAYTQKEYSEPFLEYTDAAHSQTAVAFRGAKDCWAINVASKYTTNCCVSMDNTSIRLTVKNCDYLDGVSPISGGYRYPFSVNAEQILFQECYAYRGRHDFVSGDKTPGPNVFLDCYAENSYGNSECHQRWGYGTLYDNVKFKNGGYLTAGNRSVSGTGHGWAGANMVFWNCTAPVMIVQKPPTAQNFAIGISGTDFEYPTVMKREGAVDFFTKKSAKYIEDTGNVALGDGFIENPTNPNKITSLYKRQLEERKKSVYGLYFDNLLLSTLSENAIVNGVRKKLNNGSVYEKPQFAGGTLMVPADILTDYLDAECNINGDVYTFTKGTDSITLTTDKCEYSTNGENKSFSAAPYIHNGNLFVPLRSFMEAFGKETLWLGNGSVVVTSQKGLEISEEIAQKLHDLLAKPYYPMPALTSLSVNGEKIEKFDSNVRSYIIEMETKGIAPLIEAESHDGFKIGEFDKVSRATQIEVFNKENPEKKVSYEVKFLDNSLDIGISKLAISSANSIAEKEGLDASVKHMYDNDMSTGWAVSGIGKWAEFTLESLSEISTVGIAFNSGDARIASFRIEVSEDGYRWTTVFDGESSGKTKDIELFRFAPTKCRYVRYVGNGNSASGWNNVMELEIYGK